LVPTSGGVGKYSELSWMGFLFDDCVFSIEAKSLFLILRSSSLSGLRGTASLLTQPFLHGSVRFHFLRLGLARSTLLHTIRLLGAVPFPRVLGVQFEPPMPHARLVPASILTRFPPTSAFQFGFLANLEND
jgi:hypothetical protein